MKIYDYTYGVAQTEQDFVNYVDDFLTSTIGGWTRIDTISDTSSNRDFVWKSTGESPDDYDDIYIRIRGQTYLYVYGYGVYEDSSTYWQELYNATYSYINCGSTPFRYWMWGDKDFVAFTVLNSDGNTYTGYLGFIESAYIPETDSRPLLIKGHAASTYYWTTGGSNDTQLMHSPTSSGVEAYEGYQWSTLLSYDQGRRETKLLLMPVVLKCEIAGHEEVRGRPNGVYQINDARAPKVAPITSASGVFLAFRQGTSTTNTYAYGPVASGIEGFNMW